MTDGLFVTQLSSKAENSVWRNVCYEKLTLHEHCVIFKSNFRFRLKKDTTCLVDPEQTTKHGENVKCKDNSTKYRQGSLQFLGDGEEKKCHCVSKRYVVTRIYLSRNVFSEMGLKT